MGTTASKLPKDQVSEYQVNIIFSFINEYVGKLAKLSVSISS